MPSLKLGTYADDVVAVIVCYYPDPDQLQGLLRVVVPQVSRTIVVNNGPAHTLPNLDDFQPLSLLEPGNNLGVAAAINLGADAAIQTGARYLLLLDQDSLPADDMVFCLLKAYRLLEEGDRHVAAVGPAIVDARTGRLVPFVSARTQAVGDEVMVCPVDRLLSSGSFVGLDNYQKIGPMDEGLFIDLVDTEWFLRAAAKGCQAFGVPAAQMSHQLGAGAVRYWCGRWRHLPRHSVFRSYYMIRNRILLLSRSYIPVVRRLREFFMMLYLLVAGLVLLPQRWMRLRVIVQGIIDGVCGRSGKGPFSHREVS